LQSLYAAADFKRLQRNRHNCKENLLRGKGSQAGLL
jgi:hypothetical protein